MQIGIDSFAAMFTGELRQSNDNQTSMAQLLERIRWADEVGLDIFGIGEHHRKGFLDSAPAVILSAAAAKTKNIRLTSAVTVLSADDPVRVFQQFSTLDLISGGRAEMVVGRGSFIDSFPLFGYDLRDYDALFAEKLDLLLKIRSQESISWRGKFRAPLIDQSIQPRPLQEKIPIWLGVGGTPESFIRAGQLGLPLMVAIIGGETHRFRPLIDLYYEAGIKAGHSKESLSVGMHALGYVAETSSKARAEFYPGYAASMTRIGQERGWPPMTRTRFEIQADEKGALLVGSPEEVAEKIQKHSLALDGLSRLTFQLDTAELSQEKLLNAIELIAHKLKPMVQLHS
jgi:probable LLM family oxidoreductase